MAVVVLTVNSGSGSVLLIQQEERSVGSFQRNERTSGDVVKKEELTFNKVSFQTSHSKYLCCLSIFTSSF